MKTLPSHFGIRLLLVGCAIHAASGQGTHSFSFNGRVTQINWNGDVPSPAFPGTEVGSVFSGQFTIDSLAVDQNASTRNGTYSSPNFLYSGMIAGNPFSISPRADNAFSVNLGIAPGSPHSVVMGGFGSPFIGSQRLTFFDASGFTLSGDTIPTSASIYNHFQTLSWFSFDVGNITAQVTFTLVPEPPPLTLLCLGVFAMIGLHRRRRNVACR